MKKLILIMALTIAGIFFIAAIPISNSYVNPFKGVGKKLSGGLLPDKNFQKDFNVKAGGQLIINLRTGGSISIEGWDKEIVSAEVTVKGRDAEDVVVEFDQKGNDVEVKSYFEDEEETHRSSQKAIIKVPKKYNIDFETMGGGVSIYNVSGNMKGQTMGGNLDLKNLNGDLNLSTMGGEINVKDCDVNGKVHTMGGNIHVENVNGNLNAKTMGGKVKQINVKSSAGNKDEVNISTMGGAIDVDEAMNGAKVKTMGGDITVNRAEKFVDAETMGGDIIIKSVDGWIKAKTMGGDVEATMTGDPNKSDRNVSLTSLGGDVTLYVPAGLSMDIDIEIAFTKKYDGDVKIESDFKLQEEISKEWDRSNGSSRKYLSGKAEINGGKHKIKIKTINGNVYLKKR